MRIYHSSRGRSAEITDRGLLYPLLGVGTASAVILLTQVVSGNLPSPITVANLYLLGLGIGLVIARIGRLGPFEGILGSPWFESRIQETLAREVARALRYDRDLTIVALRAASGQRLDLQRNIRATDQLLRCRDGWNLLILPETDQASALFLLRQICAGAVVFAALASPNPERPRHRIETDLLALMRAAHANPGNVIICGHDEPEYLPLMPLAS